MSELNDSSFKNVESKLLEASFVKSMTYIDNFIKEYSSVIAIKCQ